MLAAAVPAKPRTNMPWASRSHPTPDQLTLPLRRRMHSSVSAWTCHLANGLESQPPRSHGRVVDRPVDCGSPTAHPAPRQAGELILQRRAQSR